MDTEEQLKSLFEAHANPDNTLSLDGLHELCERLELQHCCADLATHLRLSDDGSITYSDFRESLIKFLGAEEMSARERSPEGSSKFVKKKYGRRSRPNIMDAEDNLVDGVEACSVTEVSFKKRRTDATGEASSGDFSRNPDSSEEEMLVAAWKAVSSLDATLTKEQLVEVFRGLGVESGSVEAASTVFEKLDLQDDEGITLDVLLYFIKSGAKLSQEVKHHDFEISMGDITDSSSGYLSGNSIIELWDSAGVRNGRSLLERLGYRPGQLCDLASLSSSFHALLQNTSEDFNGSWFKAGMVLQRAYIHSLRSVIEQMNRENEKLKTDVIEANQRSQLLAQEVDEHHSRLEAATARQVRVLEQKHAERVRELTEQLKAEQDQLARLNQSLEVRVASLEAEECKARAELNRANEDNQLLHDEHQKLLTQLTDLQLEKESLKSNVLELTAVQEKLRELEDMTRDRDVLALVERVSALESENRCLKDRNDELALQIEQLTYKLRATSVSKRLSPEVEEPRDDQLAMDHLNDIEEESLDDAFLDKSGPLSGNVSQIESSPKKTGHIETILEKLPSGNSLGNTKEDCPKTCNCSQLTSTIEALTADLGKMREEDSRLKSRCEELEKSMEQLQEEYEKTEDYWTAKLEEERALFDQEQRQNDEKFSDLVGKIAEYEELMKEEVTVRQRLETIEEKDQLERQVLEMEEEYSKLLAEKDQEIERLQRELNAQPSVVDTPAQTDEQRDDSNAGPCRSRTENRGRRTCCKFYRLQNELRNLLEAKQAAQREITALLAERNSLYTQVLNQRRADGCMASVNSKLLCAERRCRTLMASLRNQQLQTSELLRSAWQQHKREVEELRGALSCVEGSFHQQTVQMQQQQNKLAAADALVKDLFIENAYLLAAVRKLERRQKSSQ